MPLLYLSLENVTPSDGQADWRRSASGQILRADFIEQIPMFAKGCLVSESSQLITLIITGCYGLPVVTERHARLGGDYAMRHGRPMFSHGGGVRSDTRSHLGWRAFRAHSA